jgi:prepilin-type N-terminal cleavage/methylation domain-containing protein/prepilin-type processing-associated H-X9-DG protein
MKRRGPGPDLATGFTLIELLVVMAVLAILATLVIVAVRRGTENARAAACASNLRQLGIALNGYLADHNNMMPTLVGGRRSRDEEEPAIDNVLDRYITDPKVFACPSDTQYFAASGTSYLWNAALNDQPVGGLNFFALTDAHGHIPVLLDKAGFHPYTEHKVNILYADGHTSKELNFITGK